MDADHPENGVLIPRRFTASYTMLRRECRQQAILNHFFDLRMCRTICARPLRAIDRFSRILPERISVRLADGAANLFVKLE